MARRQYHEEVRVMYAPTIADPTAPTVAEVETGGTHLTNAMVPSGFGIPDEGATVDASDAGSRQNKSVRGRRGGGTFTVQGHRDDQTADDVIYQTLTNATDGYIVVRWFGGTDVAIDASDEVTVVPIQVISRQVDPMEDGTQKVSASCAIPDEVQYDVTVAA